jgi:ATP-dependent helicase HrpA
MVSGRMFPVEQRWKPFEESRDYGLNEAIADGVDELWAGGAGGDILVFLPGEREIREAADHLRGHLSHSPLNRGAEVLPLFARLSPAEQDHIFDAHNGRRIVLATNVAETSLTVPGIRYVIDAGTARVKRYSFRSKVEQLLVEPISQAAANQRAGRCGRVANGICIRLYDEKDFDGRPRFTDPEILRSSLAGVILRMKSLRLGVVEDFPFLDAPSGRAIADGYQLLNELGAVDDANELTALGRELARLPLDPRVGPHDPGGARSQRAGRGAGDRLGLVGAGRARPPNGRAAAGRPGPCEVRRRQERVHRLPEAVEVDQRGARRCAHAALGPRQKEAARKGPVSQAVLPVAQRAAQAMAAARQALAGQGATVPPAAAHPTHKLSNRQYDHVLRQNFISVRRLREWRDIHTQLHTVVAEHKWKLNTTPASYEQLHLSMLAGLLGNIGWKMEEEEVYLGARGIKFYRHPGAHLSKKPGRWIVAAELVETTRLFGRGIAAIEPQWLEEVGGHLLKKQLLDPHWEKKAAQVTALERATLYGIVVYSGRRVNFGTVDPHAAREIFIREALVAGEWDTRLPFLAANQKLIAGRGAGAQVAPPGRAGRRRADLRLLRPAVAARGLQRRQL